MVNRTVGIVSSRIKTIIRLPIRDTAMLCSSRGQVSSNLDGIVRGGLSRNGVLERVACSTVVVRETNVVRRESALNKQQIDR